MTDYEQALRKIAAECYPLATYGDPMEHVTHFAQRVLAAVPVPLRPDAVALLPSDPQ